MNPTQKAFLENVLGVKPKTKLFGKGDEQVQATTAFEEFRKREAAVIKKLGELRKISGTAAAVRKYEAEVEAAQARTKTADKGNFAVVKAKCMEAESMLAITEKAVSIAIKAQTEPGLKGVLTKQSEVGAGIAKLESNAAFNGLGAEVAKARAKIAAALAKAHPGKDSPGAVKDLNDAFLELVKAAIPVANDQVQAVETHQGAAAVADPEIKNIKAKIALAASKANDQAKLNEALALIDEIPRDCLAAKTTADKYAAHLVKLQDIENKVTTLPNPDHIIDTELAAIRSAKIDEAKKKAAHSVRDYDGADKLIQQAQAAYLEAKKTSDAYAAYKLSKTAAESAMTALKSHTDKDLVKDETAEIQTDLLDKAVAQGTAKKWVDAKKLYDKATTACNETKALAEKVGTSNFKNYKSWGLDSLALLTSHAQKTAFADEIKRIEKRLESVRKAVLKGVDTHAEKQIEQIYWDCDNVQSEMNRHGVYLNKRQTDFDPKKSALPAKTDADFGKEIATIDKQLEGANKRAERHQYDDADKLLQAAIDACVALQKLVSERVAYKSDLTPVESAVGTLPDDRDPVIGNESKAVRALLTSVKGLATAKDFKTAKSRLPEVQKDCEAAKQIAAKQAESKSVRDAAVSSPDLAASLAKVREMYKKLSEHAQAVAIKKELKEIEQKLQQADAALKA